MQPREPAEIITVKRDDVPDAQPGQQSGGAVAMVAEMGMDDAGPDFAQTPPKPRQLGGAPPKAGQSRPAQPSQGRAFGEGMNGRARETPRIFKLEAGDVLFKYAVAEPNLVVNPVFSLSKPGGAPVQDSVGHGWEAETAMAG
jgi:hypothetical protein